MKAQDRVGRLQEEARQAEEEALMSLVEAQRLNEMLGYSMKAMFYRRAVEVARTITGVA